MKGSENSGKVVVIKAGGSCLGNGKTIKAVVERIREVSGCGISPVIVVSALKGMTDSLLDVATNGHDGHDPRAVDRVLSEGEQLSARIMHSALENAGVVSRAVLLSDPDFPIVTDESYGNANVILGETEKRVTGLLVPLIEKGVVPIVPGFVGKTMDGEITTMGRGSSDTTAMLLGNLLKAQEVILLKDVPGILSGDLKAVSSPKRIPVITVEEILNLGIRGGEVLCPGALTHKTKDVKIRVVNFDNGNILRNGTEITGELEKKMKVKIKKGKKAAVTVIGNSMSEIPGLLEKFSGALAKKNINIFSVSASDFSICFYIGMEHRTAAMDALHELVLKDERLTALTSLTGITLITIAGKDFSTTPGILGRIGTALGKENINIIDLNTSVCEADIFVSEKDAVRAKTVLEGLF